LDVERRRIADYLDGFAALHVYMGRSNLCPPGDGERLRSHRDSEQIVSSRADFRQPMDWTCTDFFWSVIRFWKTPERTKPEPEEVAS
jgi:hypothetical protein